ncbi:MAG: 2-C-methyl-D-erythritol 4-phosphate cytidylyltransferase [Methanobrevibacter sp.]|uniref:IspD/TarI family cytidylyltransferase n=1 Tax=Methanobrevibacter sp. TaxID=66852 RepID=UPI001B13B82A|nr:IspD/TarI family cytidylyltransferase [Methanobrevibacter sp.]MBO6124182.1 2-C-methyl-D-erythritol 4-phosphate cytidylyltransferase [Methanobrevibacter sp.]MBP3791993.1 2-C-methyl-D-erythritol 4-phosphate cytidylyltransferase [Methanobrevibacter sp.]
MNVPIILAGGVGSRVGADRPKQFIDILGKPVLVYTIELFQNHPEIDAIEVVCIKSHMDYLKGLVEEFNLTKVKWITEGGVDFQHSVMNGIENLKGELDDDDIVLVHYGASPFTTPDIVSDAIRVAKEKGNSSPAISSPLLLGSNDGDKSVNWIDRDAVMILNTPQCFKFGYVTQLFEEAVEKDLIDKVEPHTTTLMYLMGREIYLSKSNQLNIKITTKEDLDLFKGYVMMKQNE